MNLGVELYLGQGRESLFQNQTENKQTNKKAHKQNENKPSDQKASTFSSILEIFTKMTTAACLALVPLFLRVRREWST